MKLSKSFRNAISISAIPLLLALSATQVGCIGHGGPSAVAQGQAYESGDPTYDQYFAAVHELQVELAQAPKRESEARMELAKKLGVEADDDDDVVPASAPTAADSSGATAAVDPSTAQPSVADAYGNQLKQSAINAIPGASTVNAVSRQVDQAKQTVGALKGMFGGFGGGSAPSQPAAAPPPVKKEPKAPSASLIAKAVKSHAAKHDLLLKLEVDTDADDGDGKLSLKSSGDDSESLKDSVEKAARTELELYAKMQKAKKKLEKLSALGPVLEGNVSAAFRTSRGQASDVRKNLSDSEALIKLMSERANEVSNRSKLMLTKLADVANADIPGDASADKQVASTSETATPKAEKSEKAEKAEKTEKAPPAEKSAKRDKSEKPAKKAQKASTPPRPAASRPKTAMADFEP